MSKMLEEIRNTTEFRLINEFYAKKESAHGIPLILHIDMGIIVLERIIELDPIITVCFNPDLTARAFCVHPIFQEDSCLKRTGPILYGKINRNVLIYVMEYRNIANQYLSKRQINRLDEIAVSPLPEVNMMLAMDKVQNFWSLLYFRKDHPNFGNLQIYFLNWLQKLNISNATYNELTRDFGKILHQLQHI